MSSLNWRLIFFFAPIGVLMGGLTVKGLGNPWIFIFWMAFGLGVAYVLAKYVHEKWLWHGLVIGLFWGVLHHVVASVCLDSYLAHNEGTVLVLSNPDWISIRYWTLITGPILGLGIGVLMAVFVWILKKLLHRTL